MKIPDVFGRNKIRDAAICKYYVQDDVDVLILSERFKLSPSSIYRVLYKNRKFLEYDKNWEKIKRIHWLKKQVSVKSISKKDPADLVEQIRKEIEGDKPIIDQSQHTHFEIEYKIIDENKIRISQSANADLAINSSMESNSRRAAFRQDPAGDPRDVEGGTC
jgi:hypothetical protein